MYAHATIGAYKTRQYIFTLVIRNGRGEVEGGAN
jgi:hypothetical protein